MQRMHTRYIPTLIFDFKMQSLKPARFSQFLLPMLFGKENISIDFTALILL